MELLPSLREAVRAETDSRLGRFPVPSNFPGSSWNRVGDFNHAWV